MEGDLLSDADAIFEVELGGGNAADYDVTIVDGQATLGGTLSVNLIDSFVPSADSFTILDANTILGEFDNVAFGERVDVMGGSTIMGSLLLSHDVANQTLTLGNYLAAHPLLGDADGSGMVDFSDFLILSANFGNAGGFGEGDFDMNGLIGFGDFLILSANFGTTAALNSALVPEPRVGLSCVACLAMLISCAGRRIHRASTRSDL